MTIWNFLFSSSDDKETDFNLQKTQVKPNQTKTKNKTVEQCRHLLLRVAKHFCESIVPWNAWNMNI